MYSKEKLLQMLSSKKASVRYEACEWIRISQESSPEIISALQNTTHDTDKEVAGRAKLALQADIHHQMAIEMGLIEPDEETIEKPIAPQVAIDQDNRRPQFKPGLYASLAALIVVLSGCCWSPMINLLLPVPICMGGYGSDYSYEVLALELIDMIALVISFPIALLIFALSGLIIGKSAQNNVTFTKRKAILLGLLIGFIFCILVIVLVNRLICYV